MSIQLLRVRKDRGTVLCDEVVQVSGVLGVWATGNTAIVPNKAPQPGKAVAATIAVSMRVGQPTPFSCNGNGMLCLINHGSGVGALPRGMKIRGVIGWLW